MPSPEEIEQAAGISPAGEEDRKRIWSAAQAHASLHQRGPGAEDLRLAERMLRAAREIGGEHLQQGLGRATIMLTDSPNGEGEVDIAVEFSPQLEEVSEGEVAGTPAQLLALEVLEAHFGDAQPQDAE